MKRFRIIAIIAGALLVLAVALWIPLSSGSNTASKSSGSSAPKDVVVAVQDIPAYTKITADMVSVKSQPGNAVHANAVTSTEVAVGAWTTADVSAQEVLMTNRLVKSDEDDSKAKIDPGPLSLTLENGTRAMSIKVDSVTGVSNLLRRGNNVDVILILEDKENHLLTSSRMLLENKKILAVGQSLGSSSSSSSSSSSEKSSSSSQSDKSSSSDKSGKSSSSSTSSSQSSSSVAKGYETVTLAVSPQEAVKLALGFDRGKIYLALRPQGDADIVSPAPVHVIELLA